MESSAQIDSDRQKALPIQFASINSKDQRGFSLIELLVVMAIIGTLVALLLPAVQSVREAARRTECLNNLRQLGLATLGYESAKRSLPPPAITDTGFSTDGSTFVILMPYLEQSNLFKKFDLKSSIDSPVNISVSQRTVQTYLCPSMLLEQNNDDGSREFGEGSYLISYSTDYRGEPNGAFDEPPKVVGGRYRMRLNKFTDGTSSTLLFGEIDNSVVWSNAGYSGRLNYVWPQGYWFNARGHVGGTLNLDQPAQWTDFKQHRTFRSDHPGGINFCFVDGSVRFINDEVDIELMRGLVTRSGNEVISEF